MSRMMCLAALILAATAGGCVPAPEPAYPSGLPAAAAPAARLDDDPPGELYRNDGVYDDDAGALDYHIEPGPGL